MNTSEVVYTADEISEAWVSWVHGHHLIHIQLAWMTDLLRRAYEALENDNEKSASIFLARFRCLLIASGATMRYAGNFSNEIYLQKIRPAMPPGDFSGIHNGEHDAMRKALTDVKRALKRRGEKLDAGCPFASDLDKGSPSGELLALIEAEIPALEDHVYVCRAKVSNQPSLMGEYNNEARAGWEKLEGRLKGFITHIKRFR